MGIRSRIEEKATETQGILASQAQIKYLKWLMKEEKCDYEEAIAIVQGRTDPLEPEYMLGYKLADPVWEIALFKQFGKEKRLKAANNFAAMLSEKEKELFWTQVFDEKNCKKFKKQYKKETKGKGIGEGLPDDLDDPEDAD